MRPPAPYGHRRGRARGLLRERRAYALTGGAGPCRCRVISSWRIAIASRRRGIKRVKNRLQKCLMRAGDAMGERLDYLARRGGEQRFFRASVPPRSPRTRAATIWTTWGWRGSSTAPPRAAGSVGVPAGRPRPLARLSRGSSTNARLTGRPWRRSSAGPIRRWQRAARALVAGDQQRATRCHSTMVSPGGRSRRPRAPACASPRPGLDATQYRAYSPDRGCTAVTALLLLR